MVKLFHGYYANASEIVAVKKGTDFRTVEIIFKNGKTDIIPIPDQYINPVELVVNIVTAINQCQ